MLRFVLIHVRERTHVEFLPGLKTDAVSCSCACKNGE